MEFLLSVGDRRDRLLRQPGVVLGGGCPDSSDRLVPSDIRATYAARLAARESESATLARRDETIARARLVTFVAGALVVWGVVRGHLTQWWIVLSGVGFAILVVLHQRGR